MYKKLEGEIKNNNNRIKSHVAGGLAKLAYKEIKKGRDNFDVFYSILIQSADIMGIISPVLMS